MNIYNKIGLMAVLIPIIGACSINVKSDDAEPEPFIKYEIQTFNKRTSVSETGYYSILYGKDKRTNLCYAYYNLESNSSLFTNVPCTPEVEKLIK
jgi:hypothetical protein